MPKEGEKRKPGGQPGNRNSAGHRNAAGSHAGAPRRNRNAEKDGAYSAVYFDELTEEETARFESAPLDSRTALEQEMKILKFREGRILTRIAEYEAASEDALYVSNVMDVREPVGGQDGAVQTKGVYNKDSAFTRAMKLQEALYKVQGRIAKVADSLRAMDEFDQRMALERQRLEVMRMRAMGVVDVPDDLADTLEAVEAGVL